MNNTTNPTPTPGRPDDDRQAEQHVSELMGPPQQIDGTHSYEDTPMTVPTSLPKPTVPPPDEIVPPDSTPDPLPSPEETAQAPSTEPADIENLSAASEETLFVPPVPAVADEIAAPTPEALGTNHTEAPVVMKLSWWGRAKEAYFRWWDNRTKRYITLAIIAVILGVIIGIPMIRYTLLNLVGVRTSVSVTALDQTTLMPLEHVVLQAGSVQTKPVKTAEPNCTA